MEFLSVTKRYSTTKGILKQELVKKIRMQLVVHVDYSSIAKFQTKTPSTFRGIFGFSRHLEIFRGTPNDTLRNTGLQTLFYSLVLNTSTRVMNHLLQLYETLLFPI
jgi:hypothetical protein